MRKKTKKALVLWIKAKKKLFLFLTKLLWYNSHFFPRKTYNLLHKPINFSLLFSCASKQSIKKVFFTIFAPSYSFWHRHFYIQVCFHMKKDDRHLIFMSVKLQSENRVEQIETKKCNNRYVSILRRKLMIFR